MISLLQLSTTDMPESTRKQVRQLLDRAFEGAFTDTDWEHTLGGHHVMLFENEELIAHASVVARNIEVADRSFHTGYLEGVATHPAHQGRGYGAQVVTTANGLVRQGYELGVLSTDRHSFYLRLDWERWQGPTYARDGSRRLRTADDDGGVMVLRFGPSATVDVTTAITCEARPGDYW